MPDQVVNGTRQMLEQPKRYGWSPQRGNYLIRTWIGNKSNAAGLCAQLRAGLVPYEVTDTGPNSKVVATYGKDPNTDPQGETPISFWGRQINRVPKSIYSFKDLLADLPDPEDIETLRKQVQDKKFNLLDYAPGTDAKAFEWFTLIMQGVEDFIVEQPVITWTRTVSSDFNLSTIIASTNVGKILTIAQLKAEGCPDYLIVDFSADTPTGSIFGYRKSMAPLDQLAEGKLQLVNTYEGGQWSTKIYKAAA